MDGTFEELIADAEAADVTGWGFGWLDDRATEERPPWGYARLLAERWASARAALDLDTGGGEVLGEASVFPPVAVATEAWPPNAAQATARLHPRGVAVVRTTSGEPLPFADGAFDLVTSRHPVSPDWQEIARVLVPGGAYFAQHVGPRERIRTDRVLPRPAPERAPGPRSAGRGGCRARSRPGDRRPAHRPPAHRDQGHRRGGLPAAQAGLVGAGIHGREVSRSPS